MKKLIFEIEGLIKSNFEVERLENTKHYNMFCYIYFYFKLNTKNKKEFKEIFQKIKEIAEKKGFFSLYKISKRLHGNGLGKSLCKYSILFNNMQIFMEKYFFNHSFF
jgi:hypothetical protein